jgi:uncharacterized protein
LEFFMKIAIMFAAFAGLVVVAPETVLGSGVKGAGPSFNCARARTVAEKAICWSPAFSAQDRAIASLYPRVVAATPPARRPALARDQAEFNRSRELCYTPEQTQDDCLGELLASRVWQLNGWLRGGYR